MRFKRLFLMLLLIAALNTTVNAELKTSYNFDEAMKIALKNSYEYKAKDKSIDKAYKAYEAAEGSAPKEIKVTNTMEKFISEQVEPTIKAEKAYHSYRQAVLDKVNMKANLEISLRSLIIDIENAKKSIDEASVDKESLKKELELLELRMDKNLISIEEYKEKKKDLENKIKSADKTSDTLTDTNDKLKELLGIKREGNIEVILDNTVVPLGNLDLSQIKKELIRNDMTLLQKKNQRSAALTNYNLIGERYDKYNLDNLSEKKINELTEIYEEAKWEYEKADKEYNKAVETFDKNFEKAIEVIKESIEEIEDLKQQIVEEEKNLKYAKLKYEFKMISQKQYEDIQKSLQKLKNSLNKAELSLNLEYAKLLIYSV